MSWECGRVERQIKLTLCIWRIRGGGGGREGGGEGGGGGEAAVHEP